MQSADEMTRGRQLNIRMGEDDEPRLKFLMEHHGLNAAGLFRRLLKQEEQRVQGEINRRRAEEEIDLQDRAIAAFVRKGGDSTLLDTKQTTLVKATPLWVLTLKDAMGRALATINIEHDLPGAPFVDVHVEQRAIAKK